jgi:hypothetical protein
MKVNIARAFLRLLFLLIAFVGASREFSISDMSIFFSHKKLVTYI